MKFFTAPLVYTLMVAPVVLGNTLVELAFEDFENENLGIFNIGGSDVRLSSSDAQWASSGIYAVRIRDNSGDASSLFSDPFDVSLYDDIDVTFNFEGVSMENGEDFFLESSADGGAWVVQADYVFGSTVSNNVPYSDSVLFSTGGANSMQIRFRCDASGNADRVYIDDVGIYGISSAPTSPTNPPSASPTVAPVAPTVAPVAPTVAPVAPTTAPVASQGSAWINEFHYDNESTDQGEFVEIAYSGVDITGYSIILYNGNGGTQYGSASLSAGVSVGGGVSLTFVNIVLQNGAPDGIALVDGSGNVVEFLSYEGTMTASDGAASGLTSTDVGVAETSSTPVGYSLQLTGSGCVGGDFVWTSPAPDTKGAANNGQLFSCGPVAPTPNPTPAPTPAPIPTAPTSTLGVKVMAYNILAGGTGSTGWKDIVKAENADIVVFTEVGNWDDNNNQLLNENVAEFNAHFSGETPYFGSTVQGIGFANSANAIMSRFPIVETTQLTDAILSSDSAHDLMVWKLDVGGGKFVYVIGIHLKCCGGEANDARRNNTMRNLIAWIDANTNAGDGVMLMGDFNAVSPVDTDPAFPGYNSGFAPSSGSSLNDGPLRMLLDSSNADSSSVHTFKDAFREANPSCGTNADCCADNLCDGSLPAVCPERGYSYISSSNTFDSRIDFIIVNQAVSVTGDATVGDLTGSNVCSASDHLPVDAIVSF